MNLLKDEAIRVEESEESGFLDIIRIGHTIKEQLSKIQSSDNSDYPLSFKKNKLEYLLYEQTSNRTKIELDLLFTSNSEKLISEIIESDQSSDFYQYLSSQFRTFSKIMKEQLLTIVIKESIKFKNSPSMNFIVQESLNEVIPSYERDSPLTKDVITRIINMWESILRNENLDQSEIIYFLNKHDLLSFHELGLYYSDLRIDTETFSNLRRKDFFLLTYLSSKRLFEKFELWDNTIWEAIKLFDDREFLSFWISQSIITNGLGYKGFDIIPEDKRYTIWTGRYLFESPHKHTDYKESVISKIKPRLEKMEKEGFTFTKMEDTRFKETNMVSVTQRIKQIKQPRGGYLPVKTFTVTTLDDGQGLNPEESIAASLVGTAVDYLSRFMDGTAVEKAFEISLLGARVMRMESKAFGLLDDIKGLDDLSIIKACQLAGFDSAFRAGPLAYRPVESIVPDQATISNIRIMVERSLSFFKAFGPVTADGFTMEGAYTATITNGDGDFLTKDTLWDFKVTTSKPNKNHTLQLLSYYLMGRRSIHPEFQTIEKLGIFNPRQNTIYQLPLSEISDEVIKEVETNVIGY